MAESQAKPYHHGDLRRALITAGLDLLKEGGAAALDLRKVARKAGVSHAAPYRHFEDKRALLIAIAEEGFLQLTQQLKEAVTDVPPDEHLVAMARAYVHFAQREPALMREMFSGLTIDRMEIPSLHAASKAAFEALLAVVAAEQSVGNWVAGAPEDEALTVWALFHGLAMLLIENQMQLVMDDPTAIDALIERCINSLYLGLRPR